MQMQHVRGQGRSVQHSAQSAVAPSQAHARGLLSVSCVAAPPLPPASGCKLACTAGSAMAAAASTLPGCKSCPRCAGGKGPTAPGSVASLADSFRTSCRSKPSSRRWTTALRAKAATNAAAAAPGSPLEGAAVGVPVSPCSRRAGRQGVLVRLLRALRHAARCCFLGRTWAQVAASQEGALRSIRAIAQHHCKYTIPCMQPGVQQARLTLGTLSSMCRVAPLTWMLWHTPSALDRPKNTGWPGQRHSRESNRTCGGSSSLRQGGRQGMHGCTWRPGQAAALQSGSWTSTAQRGHVMEP